MIFLATRLEDARGYMVHHDSNHFWGQITQIKGKVTEEATHFFICFHAASPVAASYISLRGSRELIALGFQLGFSFSFSFFWKKKIRSNKMTNEYVFNIFFNR